MEASAGAPTSSRPSVWVPKRLEWADHSYTPMAPMGRKELSKRLTVSGSGTFLFCRVWALSHLGHALSDSASRRTCERHATDRPEEPCASNARDGEIHRKDNRSPTGSRLLSDINAGRAGRRQQAARYLHGLGRLIPGSFYRYMDGMRPSLSFRASEETVWCGRWGPRATVASEGLPDPRSDSSVS